MSEYNPSEADRALLTPSELNAVKDGTNTWLYAFQTQLRNYYAYNDKKELVIFDQAKYDAINRIISLLEKQG